MFYVFPVHICNLGCLSRFQSATQCRGNCATLRTAFSVAVNGLAPFRLFSLVNHRDRPTIHRNSWRSKELTSHLQLFCCGAWKAPPVFQFLEGKQPTSCLCQYLPTGQYRQAELLPTLFRWSPTIPTSLCRKKITLAPKTIILAGKRPWGALEIMVVRNGRTSKIRKHPAAKLIPLFFPQVSSLIHI